jgi:hypothetical protein
MIIICGRIKDGKINQIGFQLSFENEPGLSRISSRESERRFLIDLFS